MLLGLEWCLVELGLAVPHLLEGTENTCISHWSKSARSGTVLSAYYCNGKGTFIVVCAHVKWLVVKFSCYSQWQALQMKRAASNGGSGVWVKGFHVYKNVWGPFHSFCFPVGMHLSLQPKVGPCWVDRNLISISMSGFQVFLYNYITCHCLQFWFTEGLLKRGRNFDEFKIKFQSTQHGKTLHVYRWLPVFLSASLVHILKDLAKCFFLFTCLKKFVRDMPSTRKCSSIAAELARMHETERGMQLYMYVFQ